MVLYKDYYLTLGVARTASLEQIRQAYRRLARQYHPDLNKSPLAESRFKSVGEAYETLRDPQKRAEYDNQSPWGANAANLHRRARPMRSAPAGAAAPGERRQKPNMHESASGPFWRTPGGGRSEENLDILVRLLLPLEDALHGGLQEVTIDLPELGGERTFHVRIPAGMAPGRKIRLKGQGRRGLQHHHQGDLLLTVEIPPHPRFRLEGKDLHAPLAITPWEAALGGLIEIDTLAGRVSAKIPPGSSSGRKIRLKGRGFPTAGEEPGDLLFTLQIAVPAQLTDEEQALFAQLAAASRFNPRD